jgi:hypothetical protein
VAETQYMLIGLYSYPPSAFWTAAIDAYPTTAIIIANVDSGPGTGYESNFGAIYTEASAAGIILAGYVYTSYAARSEADVEADIDNWFTFYGTSGVTSIFFDEVDATAGNETYYTTITDYVHTNYPGSTVILNPGNIPDEDYLSVPIGDIIQVEENSYANLAGDAAGAPSWLFDYPSSQLAVTVNTCPTEADMATAVGLAASAFNAQYVWVTADDIYSAEPSYFAAEVALLVGGGPSGDLTVTATQGGSTNPGILLRVLVLDNAAVAGSPATASQSAAAAHQASVTTTIAGSVVYGTVIDGADSAVTMHAGCTAIDNITDATNTLCYATFHTAATVTPGAATVGATATDPGGMAALEVRPSGGSITTDASSPAVADSTTATAITSAGFTPPGGTLLVALVSAGGLGGDVTTMTLADSYGLTWHAAVQAHAAGQFYAGVWYAEAPAAPDITTSSLPGATEDSAYAQALGVTGGWLPLSWSLTTGSLPSGLSLGASSGVISGTPHATGTSSFTVEVTDAFGNSATQPLSLTVAGSGSAVYTSLYPAVYGGGAGPSPGSVVNVWSRGYGRPPGEAPSPAVSPLALELDSATSVGGGSGTPTSGNWMFAVVAWRQDAGTAGVLQYPSTNTICDDTHNFWIPVSVVGPETGIVRTAVWMAPAFRAPQFVFASPTAYQSAVTLLVFEVTAAVPWYEVAAFATAYTNQGLSVTQSQDTAAGLFSAGVIAYDLNTLTVTYTDTGWTGQGSVTASNGSDHTGDLTMTAFTAATTGSAMTLAATGTGTSADWAEVLIVVHGVTDAIGFPYQDLLQMENWPALIFEMACGQVLNQNWTFNPGIAPWTAANGAAAAASGLYPSGNSAGSLLVTPGGVFGDQGAASERIPVIPFTAYAVAAQVTVPSAWDGGVQAAVIWYNSGGSVISESDSAVSPVTGSLQEVTATVTAPGGAVTGQLFVWLTGGAVPVTALMYIAYASFGLPGALGATPPDQLSWTDLSGRTITIEPIRFSRGIQYEQQSLEAGTLEIPLANNDGYLTAGNNLSPYYPQAGQTDVPVRLRAIWPSSPTPYAVLYTGFADDVKVQRDEETLYGYVTLTAADCWSRLTAQMLTAGQQENLEDSPAGFYPCNDLAGALAAANLAPTSLPPLAQQDSKSGTGALNIGFGNTDITLPGDPGGTGWFLDSLTSADGTIGASLVLFPPDLSSLPSVADGVTVEFWVLIADSHTTGITWNGAIASCVGARGRVWELSVGAPSGGESGQILFSVFDKITGAATTTVVNPGDNWGDTKFYSVAFTETTWEIYEDGDVLDSGTCNFSPVYNGFCFDGLNVPWGGLSGNCFNGVLQDIGIFPGILPQPRIQAHYNIPLNAALDEVDLSRVARVTGYGGFVPPLAMLGLGVPPAFPDGPSGPSNPGVDPVTQITDTLGQIVSDYWTNVASSTLAALFCDGAGALVYRRRYEWYDRVQGQTAIGEQAPRALNVNPFFGAGVYSWTASDAALAWAPGQGQFYGSAAAQLTATGAGEAGFAPEDQSATPGQEYSCLIVVRCPAGYPGGGFAQLTWLDASLSTISFVTGNTVPLVAGAWTWLFVSGQAPAGTAYVTGIFGTSGTPSGGTVFYVSSVTMAVYPGEAPYLRDEHLSDDRAQMFNTAILTQSGTGTLTTYSGTAFAFTPTSGVTVSAENAESVAQRGAVPYTATVYLQNTMQAVPFAANEGSIEDLASWIVNTLGTPQLRAEQVTLTPGATLPDMIAALFTEIGDTVTMHLRPLGAAPVTLVTYLSNMSHEIDVRTGWTTTWQLSPAPQAAILQLDNPELGCLTGENLIGF